MSFSGAQEVHGFIVALALAGMPKAAAPAPAAAPVVSWVRGGADGKGATWGIPGGLQFAIPPDSRGPRGLVRLLYPTLAGGQYDLINFIAIEPIVRGRRGFSELERSRLDGAAGKRLWVEPEEVRGTLSQVSEAVQILQVVIHVERFDNGAHVRMLIEQRSDRPDEIAMTIQADEQSEPIEYCILTATMGNRARTRRLWLADETVSSLSLYPDYTAPHFAPHLIYPLTKLPMTPEGDLLVAITTDEPRLADEHPFPGSARWYYGGIPVTQYWRKAKGTWRDDVHVAVNARYTYYGTDQPIPGGVSFENFELRERFCPGQQFVFGVTRRTPEALTRHRSDGGEKRDR